MNRHQPSPAATEEDLPDDETMADEIDVDEATCLSREAMKQEEIGEIGRLLNAVRALPTDTKAEKLLQIIEKLRAAGYRQVMVFTQFTDTMDFLRDAIRAKAGLQVLCFSGRGGEQPDPGGRWRIVFIGMVKAGGEALSGIIV